MRHVCIGGSGCDRSHGDLVGNAGKPIERAVKVASH
jgi:hypothetical protein